MSAVTRRQLDALTPDEAAALWLVQRDAETPVEAGLFEEWLQASEANRDAWDAAELRWALFDDAENPIFAALRGEALAYEAPLWRRAANISWKPLAAVASLALVVTAATQILHAPAGQPEQVATIETDAFRATIAAPAGSVRSVELPDGTRMTLDAGARANVVLMKTHRDVALAQGRAWFEVAHDRTRPFVVKARDRSVTAVGTRFEVAMEGPATRVSLFEGTVRVEGGSQASVLLRPGQQLLAQDGQPNRLLASTPQAEALWREGLVEFDDITLAEAAAILNRDSTTILRVTDSKVAQMRVSGRFRLRDPERFARTVAELLPVKIVRREKGFVDLRTR